MSKDKGDPGQLVAMIRDEAKVILFLIVIGLIQEPLVMNLQILWKAPQLFPVFDIQHVGLNVLFTFVAALVLLVKATQVRTLEWWFAFASVFIPYFLLKSFGVYGDETIYLISKAEGWHVGGGAAMAHVFLLLFLIGPAQILSLIVFLVVRHFKRPLAETISGL